MSRFAPRDTWRTASYSAQTECVEVLDNEAVGKIRDSKSPDGGNLTLPRVSFDAFLSVVATQQ